MDKKQQEKILLLKVSLTIVSLIVAFILGLSLADSAQDWPFNKSKTCELFSLNETNCDVYWCNEIQESNWSYSDEYCVKTIFVNQIIQNVTYIQNYSINETYLALLNWTNQTNVIVSINSSEFYNKTEIDEKLVNQNGNISETIQKSKTEVIDLTRGNQPNAPTNYWPFVFIALIVSAAICFMVLQKVKEQKYQKPKPFKRTINLSEFQGSKEQRTEEPEEPAKQEPKKNVKNSKARRTQETFNTKTKQKKVEEVDDELPGDEEQEESYD